jgi:tripartite ATP-independent transporter DctP family solute receptor
MRAFHSKTLLLGLVALGCLAMSGLVAGCGGSGEDDSVAVWRIAIEEIEGSVQHAYATHFKSLVEERTNGRVRVEIYPYGSLGTSAQLTEQVRSGALQLAFASPGHLGSVIPEAQIFSLHFLLSDDEAVNQRVFTEEGAFRSALAEAYREHGLELVAIVQEGWMVWTANKPLRTPDDFAGFKMRTMVSPLLVEAYAAYGADPTPMPYAEVYGALQLGMVDGQVNPVFAIEEMSFYEVQDHLTFARHAPFVTTLISSPAFVAGLSPERRATFDAIIDELDGWIFETQRRFNRERLERILEKGGTTVVELDEDERAVFRARGLPVRETFVELAGARGQVVLDALLTSVSQAEAAADEASEAAEASEGSAEAAGPGSEASPES